MFTGIIEEVGTVAQVIPGAKSSRLVIQGSRVLEDTKMVEKGSIAIDGISLTVAAVQREGFQVSIIPHTGAETTLLRQTLGDLVNLECDVIGKYVERLLGIPPPDTAPAPSISEEFLRENGFF